MALNLRLGMPFSTLSVATEGEWPGFYWEREKKVGFALPTLQLTHATLANSGWHVPSFVPDVRHRVRTAIKRPKFAVNITTISVEAGNLLHVLLGE